MEAEMALLPRSSEPMQKLPAKQLAEDSHREKEPGSAGDPPRAVLGESSARDEAMDMRMVLEGLAPGVQHGKHADLRTEVLGISGDRAESLRGCPEQDVIDELLVLECDARQLVRDGEDNVEVLDGQDLSLPL